MLHKVGLYMHTLRYLKPWQVAGRVVTRGKRRLGLTRVPVPPPALRGRLRPAVPFPAHEPWNTPAAILEGRFCFLNRTEDLGRPVDWKAAHLPMLWRFNLHYFHYLHLLTPAEQVRLCRAWVRHHPVEQGVGWHPYPTALRIVNWCRAGMEDAEIQASLYRQAAYLYRNLETYIYGNHLLENARALVVAGCFFGDSGEAPRWLAKGLDLYRRETPEQVLPDGGHYERSPMYHALMLEGYLDVLNVLPASHPDRSWLADTARHMADVLVSMARPDGCLTLFNDATQEIALAVPVLCGYVRDLLGYEPKRKASLPDTGYFIHRDEDVGLVIDGGAIGPDHLLAHAHADVFSYELALQGQAFVVDSGVYDYEAGAMRDYVRSTAAHNTVTVDGLDQVECWGSFRVARRFAPSDVRFTAGDDGCRFSGRFAGYAALIGDGITHQRCITVDRAARMITVEDVVDGRGTHRIESRVHLHPEVTVVEEAEGVVLSRGRAGCRLRTDAAPITWEEGWYCPRFGVRRRNKVLVLGGSCSLPARFSYQVQY